MTEEIHVVVANIIHVDARYLVVVEEDSGAVVINQPAGHVEPGESAIDAVIRETLEETGLHCEPQYLVGIYQTKHQAQPLHYLRFCFYSELCDPLATPAPQDSCIIRADWMSKDDIISEKHHQMRSPLVQTCIKDFEAGARVPLSAFRS